MSKMESELASAQTELKAVSVKLQDVDQQLAICISERDTALKRVKTQEDDHNKVREELRLATEKIYAVESDLAERDAKLLVAVHMEEALKQQVKDMKKAHEESEPKDSDTEKHGHTDNIEAETEQSTSNDEMSSIELLRAQAEATAAQEALSLSKKAHVRSSPSSLIVNYTAFIILFCPYRRKFFHDVRPCLVKLMSSSC